MEFFSILGGLFLMAFAAATILPMQSEALLVTLLIKTAYAPWLLVTVASAGNLLGSCVNWWLGKSIERFKDRKWFPVSEQSLVRAQEHYKRWGRWSLLLSWFPIIGDPITVMAGIMREKIQNFVLLVGVAKTGRYVFLAYLTLKFTQ